MSEQHDAHVQRATKLFRDVGFTLAAIQWKRTPDQLAALSEVNGLRDYSQAPFAWGYFPSAAMQDFWERRLAAAG